MGKNILDKNVQLDKKLKEILAKNKKEENVRLSDINTDFEATIQQLEMKMHNYVTLNEQIQEELLRMQKKYEEDAQEIKNLHTQDREMKENYQAQIDLLQKQLKQAMQR